MILEYAFLDDAWLFSHSFFFLFPPLVLFTISLTVTRVLKFYSWWNLEWWWWRILAAYDKGEKDSLFTQNRCTTCDDSSLQLVNLTIKLHYCSFTYNRGHFQSRKLDEICRCHLLYIKRDSPESERDEEYSKRRENFSKRCWKDIIISSRAFFSM